MAVPNRPQSSYLICWVTAERALEFQASERRLRVLLLRDDGDSTDNSSESSDEVDESLLPAAVAAPKPVAPLSGAHLDGADALAQRVRRHLIASHEHEDAARALLREAMQLPPAALQHVLAAVNLQPGELRATVPAHRVDLPPPAAAAERVGSHPRERSPPTRRSGDQMGGKRQAVLSASFGDGAPGLDSASCRDDPMLDG